MRKLEEILASFVDSGSNPRMNLPSLLESLERTVCGSSGNDAIAGHYPAKLSHQPPCENFNLQKSSAQSRQKLFGAA